MIEKKKIKELSRGDYIYYAMDRWAKIAYIIPIKGSSQVIVAAYGVNASLDYFHESMEGDCEFISMGKDFGDKQQFMRY